MVIRRTTGPEPPAALRESDAELMEHLVKKSLDINPALRKSAQDTDEVLEELKAQVRGRPPPGVEARSGAQKPKKDRAARRKNTIAFFFEQKAEEFEEESADLLERERRLAAEKKELQEQFIEEMADFLAMIGSDTPETRDVLRDFRSFLEALGISERELLDRARA